MKDVPVNARKGETDEVYVKCIEQARVFLGGKQSRTSLGDRCDTTNRVPEEQIQYLRVPRRLSTSRARLKESKEESRWLEYN